MSAPVTLYFRITVQRAAGPDVSRARLEQEVKETISTYLAFDESEYTVTAFSAWPAATEIVAAGQAAKFLRRIADDEKARRNTG